LALAPFWATFRITEDPLEWKLADFGYFLPVFGATTSEKYGNPGSSMLVPYVYTFREKIRGLKMRYPYAAYISLDTSLAGGLI